MTRLPTPAAAAVALLMCVAPLHAQGVRVYEAPRVRSTVVVDGSLDDEGWAGAPWTDPFVDILGAGAPTPRFETRVKILWDEAHLYVGAWLEEPHLWGTLTQRDAIIYRDHDFEVFLDPDGDGKAYFELEINALGTVFDLFLDRPYDQGGRARIEWDMPGLAASVRLEGTVNDPSDEDRGWTVELAIPWKDLVAPDPVAVAGLRHGSTPAPGDEWRMNFSRVQWPLVVRDGVYVKEREPVDGRDHPEDNWVWSPQGVINMHVPGKWGVLRFVEGAGR